MIPPKIQSLVDFIDFLDNNKRQYIEKYLPLCAEINDLDIKRNKLKPHKRYTDKKQYDILQNQITEKFKPLRENIATPFFSKLRELEIWAGDEILTSIWNNNIDAISEF